MKYLMQYDKDGFLQRVIVKNDDTVVQAEYGIPAGPPDVRQIDLNSVLRDINNVLAETGTFTWDDVNRSDLGIRAATNVFRRALLALYRQEVKTEK